MNCIALSADIDPYRERVSKTRQNVLKNIYKAKTPSQPHRNKRLRFHFKKAIKEAQTICTEEGENSPACHAAWWVVDEIEDAIHRVE